MKPSLPTCVGAVLLAGLMGIAAGCGGSRTITAPSATDDYETRLAAARRLMTESRLREAVVALSALARTHPQRPEPAYLVGECRYRMRDFAAAQARFEALRTQFPDFQPAIHRLWLVRLTRSRAARAAVRSEIALRLGDTPSTDDLLTAYHGYRYLRDGKRRRQVITRLAPRVTGTPSRSAVAAFLIEEILAAPTQLERKRLAELFLTQFGELRGARLAARAYVAAHDTLDEDSVDRLWMRLPGNRHLAQALAERLILGGRGLPRAERLLAAHRRAWRASQVAEARWYTHAAAWRTAIGDEGAHTAYLRGLLARQRGRRALAQAWLNAALARHPERWRVYAALSENAAGDAPREMHYLALSVAAGHPDPDARRRLEIRFPSWREQTRLAGVTQTSARFEEVTEGAGLGGYRAERVAWADYDNDGFPDLLLDGRYLLRNHNGHRFADAVLSDPDTEPATGGVWADVDNDGDLDVLVTRRNGNRLLRNDRDHGFSDITALAFADPFVGRTEAAAWGDYDNDGWIDVYTANYEEGGLERGLCRRDQLFRNVGAGRFVEAGAALAVITDEPHCGRGVTWSDVDQDGYQDILVANYRLDPNLLWKNQAGKVFVDAAGEWGFRGRNDGGVYGHSIGSVAADVDGDLRVDVYLSNLAHPRYLDVSDTSRLLLQKRAGRFSDASPNSGIGFEETSSDPLLADFDNDGDLDLYVTSVYPGRLSHLYQNRGKAQFDDITAYSGTSVANGWGAAAADYDNDGYLDLFVASRDGVRLFRNRGGDRHWLKVRIRSRLCNHYGVGARIVVDYGARRSVSEVTAGRGTGSQDPFVAHFGLGTYSGPVTVTVRHLCGQVERRAVAAPDRLVEFR